MACAFSREEDGDRFHAAWDWCEYHGWCDAWGSVECFRVLSEYLAAGQPADAEQFIRQGANRSPGGQP